MRRTEKIIPVSRILKRTKEQTITTLTGTPIGLLLCLTHNITILSGESYGEAPVAYVRKPLLSNQIKKYG